jgi:hypothetical protein
VFSLLAAALVGVLALASAAGGLPLAAGIVIVQFVFTMGAVRIAPIPAAAQSGVLALLVGAVTAGWIGWAGIPELAPVAKVLGPAFAVAILLQLMRTDGRARVNASLALAVTACVLAALPAAWVGLRYADSGAYAVGLGLLGVGVAVLFEGWGASATLRRLLSVLVAGGLAAGLVLLFERMATAVPAVSAVVVAAFGAVLAVAALAGVDRLATEPVRHAGAAPATAGGVELVAERAVAVSSQPLRITLPLVAAAPVVYVLGRILVG